MKKLITVSGPTASGKTRTSIAIASAIQQHTALSASIINFDSLLFYRELNIGTAKPTEHERQGIEHHLIDIASAHSPINASDYVKLAEQKIEEVFSLGKVPILVGGSGFYLRALIKGMYEATTPSLEVKKQVDELLHASGIEGIRSFLATHDPRSLERLHPNDLYRNCRAVEFYLTTGKAISDERQVMEDKFPYDLSQNCAHDWQGLHLYLDLPKDEHFKIIQKRTKQMIKDGLIEEVQSLLSHGFTGEEKPLQSIGYKETLDYLSKKTPTIEALIERIDISTRQLAKAQRTWFNKITPKHQFSPLDDSNSLLNLVLSYLN